LTIQKERKGKPSLNKIDVLKIFTFGKLWRYFITNSLSDTFQWVWSMYGCLDYPLVVF
jgi:hypothetical protein